MHTHPSVCHVTCIVMTHDAISVYTDPVTRSVYTASQMLYCASTTSLCKVTFLSRFYLCLTEILYLTSVHVVCGFDSNKLQIIALEYLSHRMIIRTLSDRTAMILNIK